MSLQVVTNVPERSNGIWIRINIVTQQSDPILDCKRSICGAAPPTGHPNCADQEGFMHRIYKSTWLAVCTGERRSISDAFGGTKPSYPSFWNGNAFSSKDGQYVVVLGLAPFHNTKSVLDGLVPNGSSAPCDVGHHPRSPKSTFAG
jgi:hypothetical protein